MSYSYKALLISGLNAMTFGTNNTWTNTGLNINSIQTTDVLTKGFDLSILTTPYTSIYVNFIDSGALGTDGGELWISNDIDKNLGVTAIQLIDDVTNPKLMLTVPSFLPKDSMQPTDLIYFYTDDPTYVPVINNISFSASSTHSDIIVVNTSATYLYNANIRYRVRIGSYTSNWSDPQPSYNPIVTSITPTSLSLGANDVTIDVADTTLTKIASKTVTGAITLNDNAPTIAIITADSNNYKVHFIIADADIGDTVQYQLTLMNSSLGSVIVAPWNTLSSPPTDITYQFDSNQVVVGETNTLKIEYKDNYGVGASTNYTFTGQYKNILFMDELGEYYSTDKGALLRLLHFGQIIGGQISDIKKVTVKNNNAYSISSLTLTAFNMVVMPDVTIELSKTNNPFNPLTELDYGTEVFNSGDTIDFYVRVNSQDTAVGLDQFEIDAFALPV